MVWAYEANHILVESFFFVSVCLSLLSLSLYGNNGMEELS